SRHGRTDAAGSIARESNHPRHAGFLRFSYRYNASATPRRNASLKNFFHVHVLGDPVPLGMHQHEQGSHHGRGGDVGEMKSATVSADECEYDKERKNDEVKARNGPEYTPTRKEDDCCPDVNAIRDPQSSQAGYSRAQQ